MRRGRNEKREESRDGDGECVGNGDYEGWVEEEANIRKIQAEADGVVDELEKEEVGEENEGVELRRRMMRGGSVACMGLKSMILTCQVRRWRM